MSLTAMQVPNPSFTYICLPPQFFLILCVDLMKVVDFRVSKLWILGVINALCNVIGNLSVALRNFVNYMVFVKTLILGFFSELLYESDLLERVAIVRGLNFAICIQL